jgi:hypothetical protein
MRKRKAIGTVRKPEKREERMLLEQLTNGVSQVFPAQVQDCKGEALAV